MNKQEESDVIDLVEYVEKVMNQNTDAGPLAAAGIPLCMRGMPRLSTGTLFGLDKRLNKVEKHISRERVKS